MVDHSTHTVMAVVCLLVFFVQYIAYSHSFVFISVKLDFITINGIYIIYSQMPTPKFFICYFIIDEIINLIS